MACHAKMTHPMAEPAPRGHLDILHGWKAADSVNQHAVQRNVQQHRREPALRWGDMFYPRHPS